MRPDAHRRARIIGWYERARRPGWVLAGLVVVLYGRTLGWGFVLDDWHHLDVLSSYRAGERDSPGLYRFLVSDAGNRAERAAGRYPWWVEDGLRYQHWRPVSEWLLYLEFLAFGRHPFGYRVVSLGLYALGVRLVLALFRAVGGGERTARWGALSFAVLTGHAIPVVFIAAQSDVVALVLSTASMVLAARFVGSSGGRRAALSIALYGLALGSKEACLPVAVLPACLGLAFRKEAGALRRALGLSGILSAVGLVWFGFYAAGGYGSNSAVMLDPVSAPWDYLAALPGRAWLLLSSLLIPINPFVFYLRPRGEAWLYGYCAAGAAAWILFARQVWRHHRHQRGAGVMALWILPFLPLLACTVPDDRVMVLPGVGFAFLVGAWLSGSGSGRVGRLRRVSGVLIVGLQAVCAVGVSQALRMIESDGESFARAAVAGFGRPVRPGDCAFFLNVGRDWEVLFVQLRFEAMTGVSGVRAAFLSDAEEAVVRRVDDRTLRIRARRGGLLTSYFGVLGTRRGEGRRAGAVLEAGELTGRIVEVSGGVVREVEVRFREPLESERYRFYRCDASGGVGRWDPRGASR